MKKIEPMKRRFIIDKEIKLSPKTDFLKTEIYAENLSRLIVNAPKNAVFTIGLFGSWGAGKSSIIETSKEDFDQKKVKFITYDAWKYTNDSFRRMFLRKLRTDLQYEESNLMKKFYENEAMDVGNISKFSPKQFSKYIIGLIIVLVFFIILNVFVDFGIEAMITIPAIFTLAGLFITIISGAFYQLKISVSKPHLFAPEQFEDCFKEIIATSLEKPSIMKKLKYIIEGKNEIRGLEKLVIVIDNIDRCTSHIAYQLLTDIKTFLSNEKYNIVFVIPVDDEALRKHLFNNSVTNTTEECNKDKEEFLRKFFNVTLRIKPYDTTGMLALAENINSLYSLDFNNETLSLASKEFATNPRRIIQLFNNLSTELNYYEPDFAKEHETLICAILIIREEYNSYYRAIINNKDLLKKGEIGKDVPGNEDGAENGKSVSELKTFLRLAKQTTQHEELSTIGKILTNEDAHFVNLPIDVQVAIITFENEKIIEYVSDDTVKNIMQFIIYKIKEAIKYDLSDITNHIELVAKINAKTSLSRHLNQEITASLDGHYDAIIRNSTDSVFICKYAQALSEQKNETLKSRIITYLDSHNQSTNIGNYIKNTLKTFNSAEDSRNMAAFFGKIANTKLIINSEIKYTQAQKEHLFSNTLVDRLIKSIDSFEFAENGTSEGLLWIFKNKPNITNNSFRLFFTHIYELIGDIRGRQKADILSYIDFIMPFLKTIGNNKLTTEIQPLYDKLVNDRGIPTNPTYINNPKYDHQVNLIAECVGNDNEIKQIIDFIIYVHSTTNAMTSITNEVEKIITGDREYLNKKLIWLLDHKYTLAPLFDHILSDTDYNSASTLRLLKQCFTFRNKEGNLHITEEQIRDKIKSLLDNVIGPKNEGITDLLIAIKDDETVNQCIIGDIANRGSEFINQLPKPILDLAVQAFTADTASNYLDNYDFLGVIAMHGSQIQITQLVKLLRNKIDNNQDIEQVLGIIEIINNLKSADRGVLDAQLKSYIGENLEIEEVLKNRIENILANLKKKEAKKK